MYPEFNQMDADNPNLASARNKGMEVRVARYHNIFVC